MRTPGVLPQYKSKQITIYVRTSEAEEMKFWTNKLQISMSKFIKDSVSHYIELLEKKGK